MTHSSSGESEADLEIALREERSRAEKLRRLTRRQTRTLEHLRRRFLVRVALALGRRGPLRRVHLEVPERPGPAAPSTGAAETSMPTETIRGTDLGLAASLRGERANRAELLRVSRQEGAALEALRQQPLVRAAVAIEARTGPGRRRLTITRQSRSTAGPSARHRGPDPMRIVLTVSAPTARAAPRWGDWHLAQDLARALRRQGHPVKLQTADHADDPGGRSGDVHLVLRGLTPIRRTTDQRHVIWVISHPEMIDAADCDQADLVFVASHRFATEVRSQTDTPVEVLLQATDPRRFRPLPPDPRHGHPLGVVANTRHVLRPAVRFALAAGLRPAIYGSGWHGLIDEDLIAGDFVPNEQLAAVYSSFGVLLCDHWETMRVWGFVANRVFDALACGTPVISDDLPELSEIFGGSVSTYRSPEELRAHVDAVLADPDGASGRAEQARQMVIADHTFDHRARSLLEALERHGLTNPWH